MAGDRSVIDLEVLLLCVNLFAVCVPDLVDSPANLPQVLEDLLVISPEVLL